LLADIHEGIQLQAQHMAEHLKELGDELGTNLGEGLSELKEGAICTAATTGVNFFHAHALFQAFFRLTVVMYCTNVTVLISGPVSCVCSHLSSR
jgi:hypothetical protein